MLHNVKYPVLVKRDSSMDIEYNCVKNLLGIDNVKKPTVGARNYTFYVMRIYRADRKTRLYQQQKPCWLCSLLLFQMGAKHGKSRLKDSIYVLNQSAFLYHIHTLSGYFGYQKGTGQIPF